MKWALGGRIATLGATFLLAPAILPAGPRGDVVATVGERAITAEELEGAARDRLARLRGEEYKIKRTVLEEMITQRLFEKEASARGIGTEELVRAEVHGKVVLVTADQARAVYESHPDAYRGKPEPEALALIQANLERGREATARRRLLERLKAESKVRVFLEPPRVEVQLHADAASSGPAGAAVTIVAFSDFQCPYCARVAPTLKRLQEAYPGQVRVAFQHFPLAFHKDAAKAAEAAECAGDQGRFWEMHDSLFANPRSLGVPDLKRRAGELGLDAARFGQCLDSGAMAAKVQRDLQQGTTYGVTGTPTFFVNGRVMGGAQGYEAFAQVVEEELAASTQDVARIPAPAPGGGR